MPNPAINQILFAPDRNFWMCRAFRGDYIEHFEKHGLIGIAHVDKLESLNFSLKEEEVRQRILKTLKAKGLKDSTITNHLNQAVHFIFDAKIGDVVVSSTPGSISIGRIVSDPYFEKEKLVITKGVGDLSRDIKMDHYLRRKVKWIARISRSNLPYALSKGITGNQTFFSLNAYENEIYSMVAPFLYKNETLTSNLLIQKSTRISTYQYLKLTSIFLKVEFLANNPELVSKIKSGQDLEFQFSKYCHDNQTSSYLIAEFASPGRTSNLTKITSLKAPLYAILFSIALTGGKVEFLGIKAEASGIIGAESRDFLIETFTKEGLEIIKPWLEKDSKGVSEQLELQKPGIQIDLSEFEKIGPL